MPSHLRDSKKRRLMIVREAEGLTIRSIQQTNNKQILYFTFPNT